MVIFFAFADIWDSRLLAGGTVPGLGERPVWYIDEMHLLLKEEQTAAYTVEIWKRFRKDVYKRQAFLSARLKLKPNEVCDVYEVDTKGA